MKSLGLSLLALLLASRGATAQESAWKKTFLPQAVGSYLPEGKNDIIVVAAGDAAAKRDKDAGPAGAQSTEASSADLASAAKSLATAFRLCGGAGLVMGVGSAMIALPWVASSHPVEAPEARRLADEHNMRLKTKLGLSEGEADSSESRPRRAIAGITAMPAPFASPRGGGLGLVGSF